MSFTAIPYDEEIKAAVFSMDKDSAPGLDGFLGAFYCHGWDIVGPNFIVAVRQFSLESWSPENFNCSFVTFVMKVDKASSVTQFHPIALSNFIFKVILKITVDASSQFLLVLFRIIKWLLLRVRVFMTVLALF